MKKYIIQDVEYKTYYSNFINNMFMSQQIFAKQFNSRQDAEEVIKNLPSGIYEIKKIYIND